MSDDIIQKEMMISEAALRQRFPGVGYLLLAAEPIETGFTLHQVSGMTRSSIIVVLEAALKDIKEGRGNFAEEEKTIQ